MKYIILVCMMVFLCGCRESEEDIINQAKAIERLREQKNSVKETDYKVLSSGRYVNSYIKIIEYDGCEYIIYVDQDGGRTRGIGITHKGNCKYCKENNNE